MDQYCEERLALLCIDGFLWNLILIFRKPVQEIQVSLKSDKNNGYFTRRHFWPYFSQFFLEWKIFQTKVVEKVKRHIFYSINFFKGKLCRSWANVEKYWRTIDATDDNMVLAHCVLDNWGYRQTLKICNTYWFSTETMVARTRPLLTVHCLVESLSRTVFHGVTTWHWLLINRFCSVFHCSFL